MKKYERVAELSAQVQTAKDLQEMTVWMHELLLFISKGARYEEDVKKAIEAYDELHEFRKQNSYFRNK